MLSTHIKTYTHGNGDKMLVSKNTPKCFHFIYFLFFWFKNTIAYIHVVLEHNQLISTIEFVWALHLKQFVSLFKSKWL